MKTKLLLPMAFFVLSITIKAQDTLNVSTDKIDLSAELNSTSFDVYSTKSWTAISDQSWLSVSPGELAIDNIHAGNFIATGVRIHPTAGAQDYVLNQILTSWPSNQITLTKPYAGNYPWVTSITFTGENMVVGSKTMLKVSVAVIDAQNTSGSGMLETDQNGNPTNYFDPATRTYYLSYFYITSAPRNIYETLSPAPFTTTKKTITVNAQENVGSSSRQAIITLSASGMPSKTVTVTQAGAPILDLSDNNLLMAASLNSTVSFKISSTTAWTVSSNQSWLSPDKLNGNGSSVIDLTATANLSTADRTATITVSTSNTTMSILVKQYGTIPTNVAWNQHQLLHDNDEISVVDDNVIWLRATRDTTISFTIDGGKTWTSKRLPKGISYRTGFCAVSATTAYIASYDSIGVWKTTDGATTWSMQPTGFNEKSSTNFYGSSFPDFVYFWDENNGLTYGDYNEIYITNNAGSVWSRVLSPALLIGTGEFAFSSQNSYRVVGDAIFIFTHNYEGSVNRFIKSKDKGLTWTSIAVPMKATNASFDFKDANNGLFVDYDNLPHQVYSTTDGGQSWNLINTTDTLGYLKYIPNQNMYVSISRNGNSGYDGALMYSIDNGISWLKHPSFVSIYNNDIPVSINHKVAVSSTGKTFVLNNSYLFSTKNIAKINTSMEKAEFKSPTSIDVSFSENMNLESAQDTAHYVLTYKDGANITKRLTILNAQLDNSNPKLIHLTLANSLPEDTITIRAQDLMDANGFPVLNGSRASSQSFLVTYTGVKGLKNSDITIFPNPATNIIFVNGMRANSTITVVDLNGSVVKTNLIAENKIDISNLTNGIYMLKIVNKEGIFIHKFVKQ